MKVKRTLQNNRPSVTDKRDTILRAATHIFATSGYFNSRVADIAREAGVADGTVYLYFKSKEDILRSIFESTVDEAVAKIRTQVEKIADPRAKLSRVAHLHLERMSADRDLAVVFQIEVRSSPKFIEEFFGASLAEYLGIIREFVEEGQRAGTFRPEVNSKLAANLLFGALDEMVTNWVLSKRPYKLASIADEVLDIFLEGVTTNAVESQSPLASAVPPEIGNASHEYSSYLRKVARTLTAVDFTLETILMLADEGPLTLKSLVEELVPEEDIIKVISELRRCELIEISRDSIYATPRAIEIAKSLRTKSEANRHEPS